MPASKHRRRGKSHQQVGQVRARNQLVAETIWENAAEWDWQTRQKGHHGGIIGRSAMRLLRVLMFVDWHTARPRPLDLSLDALMAQVMLSRSTVAKALRRLQELGMLNRREGRGEAGRRTYVYIVLPPSQWVGYRVKDRPPSS